MSEADLPSDTLFVVEFLCRHKWVSNGHYAAAAKSLQSYPTLCDPIDGSPPGSPSLGFARQEHWSGLPFPSPMHDSESEVAQSYPTPSDPMDCNQAPPSMGFSRQEYWSGLPLPSLNGHYRGHQNDALGSQRGRETIAISVLL